MDRKEIKGIRFAQVLDTDTLARGTLIELKAVDSNGFISKNSVFRGVVTSVDPIKMYVSGIAFKVCNDTIGSTSNASNACVELNDVLEGRLELTILDSYKVC